MAFFGVSECRIEDRHATLDDWVLDGIHDVARAVEVDGKNIAADKVR